MDKEHVAAAIERFIEKVRTEQHHYELLADDCRLQVQKLSVMRAAIVAGECNEQQLREAYRKATKIIVMGKGE